MELMSDNYNSKGLALRLWRGRFSFAKVRRVYLAHILLVESGGV